MPWQHGGRTDFHHLALTCRYHHVKIHQQDAEIIRDGDVITLRKPRRGDDHTTPSPCPHTNTPQETPFSGGTSMLSGQVLTSDPEDTTDTDDLTAGTIPATEVKFQGQAAARLGTTPSDVTSPFQPRRATDPIDLHQIHHRGGRRCEVTPLRRFSRAEQTAVADQGWGLASLLSDNDSLDVHSPCFLSFDGERLRRGLVEPTHTPERPIAVMTPRKPETNSLSS